MFEVSERSGVAAGAGNRAPGRRSGIEDLRGLCHDVGQELAVVQAMVRLTAQADLPDDVRRRLDDVGARTSYVAQMMRDAVEGSADIAEVDVTELAVRAVQDIGLHTAATCRVVGRPVRMVVDAVLLRRAVLNLLENAARAAGPGGVVVTIVRRSRSGATIQVEDDGPGWGNGPRGLGAVGLDVVRRCASAHRGTVDIGRSRLGGARVRLRLEAWSGSG